jgi:hypothetical protein
MGPATDFSGHNSRDYGFQIQACATNDWFIVYRSRAGQAIPLRAEVGRVAP